MTIKKFYEINNYRKRFLDERFFDSIDNKEKAYVLGLICSDGSIDNNGYAFSFISKDLDLIKLFKKTIKSDHKICKVESNDKRTNKIYTRYTIHICSKYMVSSLKNIGVSNNKSFSCKMPKIPNHLFWHFLRGLFDGDGSISKESASKEGRIRFKLIGSTSMIEDIKTILNKYRLSDTKISRSKYFNEVGSISSILYYSYDDLKLIFDKMYDDSDGLRLERKYNIFSTLKKYEIGKYDRMSKLKKVIQMDMNNRIIRIFNNKFEASKLLNINPKLIQRVLNGGRASTHGYIFKYDEKI